ncbi:hypothetical protein NXV14_02860 [Bacteroides fragilis]|nr:hypothetical protein [Bacteroides fragilis]
MTLTIAVVPIVFPVTSVVTLVLYNRAIWGVLYHETFPQIRYGFNDEIRNSIRQELEQALQYETPNS